MWDRGRASGSRSQDAGPRGNAIRIGEYFQMLLLAAIQPLRMALNRDGGPGTDMCTAAVPASRRVRVWGGPARVPACAVFPAGHEGVCIRLGGTVAHSPSGRDRGLRRVRVARRSGGRAPSRWFPAVAPVPGWCVAAPVESVRRPTEAGRTRRGCVEGEPAWVWIGSVSRPRTRAGRWR